MAGSYLGYYSRGDVVGLFIQFTKDNRQLIPVTAATADIYNNVTNTLVTSIPLAMLSAGRFWGTWTVPASPAPGSSYVPYRVEYTATYGACTIYDTALFQVKSSIWDEIICPTHDIPFSAGWFLNSLFIYLEELIVLTG